MKTLLTDGEIPPTLILSNASGHWTRVGDLVMMDAPILARDGVAGAADGVHCPCCCPKVRVNVACTNDNVSRDTGALARIEDVVFNDAGVVRPSAFPEPPDESAVQSATSFTASHGPCAELAENDADGMQLVATRWFFHKDDILQRWIEVEGSNGPWTSYADMKHQFDLLDTMPDWRGFADADERIIWSDYMEFSRHKSAIDRGAVHYELEERRRLNSDGVWEPYYVWVPVYNGTASYTMRFDLMGIENADRFSVVFRAACDLVSSTFYDRFRETPGSYAEAGYDQLVGPATTELSTGERTRRPDAYDVIHENFARGYIGFQSLSFRVVVPAGGGATLRVECAKGSANVVVNETEYAVANGHDSYLNVLDLSTDGPTEWVVSILIPPSTVFRD